MNINSFQKKLKIVSFLFWNYFWNITQSLMCLMTMSKCKKKNGTVMRLVIIPVWNWCTMKKEIFKNNLNQIFSIFIRLFKIFYFFQKKIKILFPKIICSAGYNLKQLKKCSANNLICRWYLRLFSDYIWILNIMIVYLL